MNESVTQPVSENATEAFLDFFHRARNYRVIFFKTATNGLPSRNPSTPMQSVLCISALKCEIRSKRTAVELDRYDRFYYPVEKYSQEAIRQNGLDRETVHRERGEASYPEYFEDDLLDFQRFCDGVSLYVTHNMAFHRQFIPSLRKSPGLRFFDTMLENESIMRLESEELHKWKYPKFEEVAEFYGVTLEGSKLRDAIHEVEVIKNIFMEMLGRSTVRLVKLED
jgi:DNA polymerase III epsilon subunit-like protein